MVTCMFIKQLNIGLLIFFAAIGCRDEIAPPAVPLDLTVSAGLVDGNRLPVMIEERPGAASHLTLYRLTLTPDGVWSAVIARYPDGASDNDLVEIQDNGWYQFDGANLMMHSNFSHTNWPGRVTNDTIAASIRLPFADSYHSVVLP